MTTDFRALCAELYEWLCAFALRAPLDIGSKDEDEHDLACSLNQLLVRARAALSAPEQGPTVMEIIAMADEIEDECLGQVDLVRRALARWGRPAVEPVPVAERLPGDQLCWWFEADEDGGYGSNWTLLRIRGSAIGYTHWLPHWALPVPEEGADG
jgi:hypothetical protein